MARMQDEAERCQAAGIVGVQIQENHHRWDSHTVEFFAIGRRRSRLRHGRAHHWRGVHRCLCSAG